MAGLEALMAMHRRQILSRSKSATELEIRARGVDYPTFAAIFKALLDRAIPVDEGDVICMVAAILEDRGAKTTDPKVLHPQRIRQITFVDGKKVTDRYVRKTPLTAPVRVNTPRALSYSIALSEEADDATPFVADEGVIIRAKTRAGFTLRLQAPDVAVTHVWRVDMTVVRQITGIDAMSTLPGLVKEMFGGPRLTAATMLKQLRLDEPTVRALYRFEVECEYLSSSGAPPRPADVTRVADMILHLANPGHLLEAAYQAELFSVAKLVLPLGVARRFEFEFGLKRLTPQVVALSRSDYRALYPPVGYFVTAKADGMRAIVTARGGRALVLADKLYEFATNAALGPTPTIVDAEFIPPNVVKIFDVIMIEGKNVSEAGIEVRATHAEAAAAVLSRSGLAAVAKPYTRLTKENLKSAFEAANSMYPEGQADGIILVAPGKRYSDTLSYKWKPLSHNTIDFLARRCPKGLLGKEPFIDRAGHTLYLLFVGINSELFAALGLRLCPGYKDLFASQNEYFPVQFQPSDAPWAYLYWHPDTADAKMPTGAKTPADAKTPANAKTPAMTDAKTPASKAPAAKTAEKKTPPVTAGASKPTATAKPAATAKPTATAKPATTVRGRVAAGGGDLDGQIVEMRSEAGGATPAGFVNWILLRVREDRVKDLRSQAYFGNDFRVAELTWLNYIDPFPLEQLWGGGVVADYFAREKSGVYRAQTAFISFVKTLHINSLRHAGVVVDLCAGQGADLGRFMSAEVKTLIAVDQDRAALAELVRRKYSHIQKRRAEAKKGARPRDGLSGMVLHIVTADVSAPHAGTMEKLRRAGLPGDGADAVVVNLAAHYMMSSLESMQNFVILCREAVKVNGHVIITTLIGESVHALLQDVKVGGSWDLRAGGGTLKYSLQRQYSDPELQVAGQKIGVLLPFSDGNYYSEYLVNTKRLILEFMARGFRLITSGSMSKHLETFRMRNPSMAAELTKDDETYVGLYGELVFQRL